jgi:hypothetical protein
MVFRYDQHINCKPNPNPYNIHGDDSKFPDTVGHAACTFPGDIKQETRIDDAQEGAFEM